jgi:hypothetical protein
VRSFIRDRGYTGTAADIRRFRQDVVRQPDLAWLAGSADFYTISSCRDLLFHVQEHRMTLPAIHGFLLENGLRFLRFYLDSGHEQSFRVRFPGKDAMSDLDKWHLFEQEHPGTFARMYQFDVRKA